MSGCAICTFPLFRTEHYVCRPCVKRVGWEHIDESSAPIDRETAVKVAKRMRRDGRTMRDISNVLAALRYFRPSGFRLTTLDVMKLLDS
jgi:hypothetical protein